MLTQPQVDSATKNPTVTAAVEAAVARSQELQRKELQARAQQDEREKQLELYRYSCGELLEQLEPVVAQFNQEFQHGQITRRGDAGGIIYSLPHGQSIQLAFFEPRSSGIKIRNGEVIGGGWIGLTQGRSANLVLLKHGVDDLYGRWVVCEIGIMVLAAPAKLIGKFGITRTTVVPFGFKDAYFYDQIQYATGMMHAFTYTFTDDVVGFFASLVHDACN